MGCWKGFVKKSMRLGAGGFGNRGISLRFQLRPTWKWSYISNLGLRNSNLKDYEQCVSGFKPRCISVVPVKTGTQKQLKYIHLRDAEIAEKENYCLSGDVDN